MVDQPLFGVMVSNGQRHLDSRNTAEFALILLQQRIKNEVDRLLALIASLERPFISGILDDSDFFGGGLAFADRIPSPQGSYENVSTRIGQHPDTHSGAHDSFKNNSGDWICASDLKSERDCFLSPIFLCRLRSILQSRSPPCLIL